MRNLRKANLLFKWCLVAATATACSKSPLSTEKKDDDENTSSSSEEPGADTQISIAGQLALTGTESDR